MSGRIDLTSDDARERLQRVFRHAQVGRSVSSVTHDLNNYLGAIMAYAELAGMDAGVTPDTKRMLGEVVNAVRKSSALVASLTDVARKEKPDVRIMDPAQLAERVLDLRRYDLRVANVALETRYDASLPLISINLPRLQLATMYLVSNAIEALDGRERKKLAVSVCRKDGGVEIVFADSAGPIDENVRAAMFDAFYTTKGIDHLGLGLALARATIEEHGGTLAYSPETGFVISLPTKTAYAT
ncbi:MAG: HAMP domain-containing histidine kinase [Candidatus Hydrogenedentes bacterium]|nr:HAMP domain-containing histidine kinase [Candidatus Hydrogenedentota bacterium]